MNTKDLEGIWEAHARHDPLWAILSDPTKKNRGWEIDRFFESGEREVRFLLQGLEKISFDKRDALDFGCGVGRLTYALSHHFERVLGVDISPTMIELANKINDRADRVHFVRNARDNLSELHSDAYDFVYTNIVLQHIPDDLTEKYLAEFLRVLRPGGVLVFQLPSHPRPDAELSIQAMPDAAYRAEIRVDDWPRVVAPATRVGLAVQVINRSSHAWHPSALGQINLGNHWLAQDGTMERQDDARAGLPHAVKPGEAAEISIAVTTSEKKGSYRLELDLVHETITWFKDRGSESCELGFEVAEGAATPSGSREPATASPSPTSRASAWQDVWKDVQTRRPPSASEPEPFPMFGIPREDVLSILEKNRAEVLSIDEDGHAGWEWVGYRYTVRKPS
ncbi:MAG: hypothetical protein BMS9Abin37_2663 [Acidobacteriota bacterium]|nr:MAG: hypothetical protein BMS9Abin37_2663 [Acidobacteriota bacterium]